MVTAGGGLALELDCSAGGDVISGAGLTVGLDSTPQVVHSATGVVRAVDKDITTAGGVLTPSGLGDTTVVKQLVAEITVDVTEPTGHDTTSGGHEVIVYVVVVYKVDVPVDVLIGGVRVPVEVGGRGLVELSVTGQTVVETGTITVLVCGLPGHDVTSGGHDVMVITVVV